MKTQSMKNILTLVYLIVTFIVTAATSKGGKNYQALNPLQITNYAVTSNCPNAAIESALIRVNHGEIIDASFAPEFDSEESKKTRGHRSFQQLGFVNSTLTVGHDDLGSGDLMDHNCKVHETLTVPNEKYNPELLNYHFASPGSYTSTIYDCSEHEEYICSIALEELDSVEFIQLDLLND